MNPLSGKKYVLFVIIAVNCLVWSQTLWNGFVYDDNTILLGNPWVKDPGRIGEVFSSSMMAFDQARSPANTYRPMLYVVFMAENVLFGLNSYWFHGLNLIVHIANAVMVFLLASRMLSGNEPGTRVLPALFAALAFSVHTINSEAVNWVSASAELLFTFCVLAAFYIHMRGPGGANRLAAALLFFIALLFKETAAALPVIIFLYDYSKGGALRGRWKAYALFIAAGSVYGLLRLYAIGGIMHHKQADLSELEAVINIFPLVAAYFSKLVLPVGLSAIYEFHPARSVFDPRVAAGAAVVSVFCAALFFSRRKPAIFAGLSMMAVPLLPVLYVPALSSSAMADRYLYLPSAGFAIVLAALASRLDKKAAMASMVLASALLAAWGAGSASRSQVWKSDRTLWADAVKKAPNAPNAHYNYAWASHNAGNLREAVEHYRRAASLAPSADAHYNVGVIFMGQSMIDEADAEFRAALGIDPGFNGARARLMEIKRLREAGA